MNQGSDKGAYFCEDTNKSEELKNTSGSIESSDKPISTEISNDSETINHNVDISLAKKNDDKSIITYQRRKRLKTLQLSEFDSTLSCSGNMSEKMVILEDGILVEGVENKILDESLNCIAIQRTSSNNADGVSIDKSNGNISERENSDLSLKELDGPKVDNSQVVNESINVAEDRAFAEHNGKKLLVLDVNGLLVDISSYVPYDYDPDDIIMKKAVFKRPYCDDFLKFCFESFNVGVWSSKTKRNMEPILDFLFGNDKHKLLFCWDQSQCTNTGFNSVEKKHKPLLLKKLKKLWDKCESDLPWEKGTYNESNTLLLDDTPHKALSNPPYTAIFPKTYRFRDVGDNSLRIGGDLRVYLEGLSTTDNVQEYVKQNPFGQRAITERNLSWKYYLKVIEASSTPPRQIEEEDS